MALTSYLENNGAKASLILDTVLWIMFCIRFTLRWPHLSGELRLWGAYTAVVFLALWVCLLRERATSRSLSLATSAFLPVLIAATWLF